MAAVCAQSSSNKAQLIDYLESILERLSKDGFDPSEDDVAQQIAPSVIGSVRRLSAGAPAAVREQLKQALTGERDPGLGPFRNQVQICYDLLRGEGGDEEPDDEVTEADDQPEEPDPDPDPAPTDEELQTLAGVVARLWSIDEPYRLRPGEGYQLNHQSRAGSLDAVSGDRASEPLFESVDRERYMKNPCSRAFIALLDNYEREDSLAEKESSEEKGEMDNFMRKLIKTPHMKYVHKVLVAWGKADPSYRKFVARVFEIWFSHYSVHGSRGPKASSGFEHVFVGEEKNKPGESNEIVGFHNWVNFWIEEQRGRINYRGYVGTLTEDDERVVSVRFDWADDDPDMEGKTVSTFMVGVSVAFEFAMLTCAFLGFDGSAKVGGIYLGDSGPFQITTYPWNCALGQVIRSAFLEA